MSTYKITAENFLRLASVVSFFEPNVTDETKAQINTIRLENKGGKSVAIVCNQRVAAVEYLGQTEHPDGVCHLKLSPELIAAAKRAAPNGLGLTVTTIPVIAMATAQVGFGEHIGDVCHWFDKTHLDKWRSWVVEPATENKGIMLWDLFHVETLLRASPSGKVVFPKAIDADKPVLLRDRYRQGWYGIFLPSGPLTPDQQHEIESNYFPAWLVG